MRVFAFGPGPGPKNVGIEFPDGARTVVPYRVFKHKYAKEISLAEKQYRTVIGIVQFDPKDGEAAGKSIRNVVIRQVGFKEQSVNVYVTVWPSHEDIEIARGDVLLVEGTYSQGKGQAQDGSPRVYHNISATRIAKLGIAAEGKRPEVEGGDGDDVNDDDIPF